MVTSTNNPRKKTRGRPKVESDQVNARFPKQDIEALDAFAGEHSISRTEGLRRVLRDWLIGHGYLAPNKDSE